MRLIDADALLEAIKPLIYRMYNYEKRAIADLIANAPTVQREGWLSVPIDPVDTIKKYNPDDNASFSFAYSANGEGSLYCLKCGKAQTIYSGDFDRTIKNKDAICADCQDKSAPTDTE